MCMLYMHVQFFEIVLDGAAWTQQTENIIGYVVVLGVCIRINEIDQKHLDGNIEIHAFAFGARLCFLVNIFIDGDLHNPNSSFYKPFMFLIYKKM